MNNVKKEDFPSRLKQIMNDRNISQAELSKITNITASSISDWLNRKYEAKQDKIDKIASSLKISPAWLLGYDVPITNRNIIDKSDPSTIPGIMPLEKIRKIPILGHVSCGEFSWSEEQFEGYFIADKHIKADYCLVARGDSMIGANVDDGDIVFLKHSNDVDNGKIAVVRVEDTVTLKKVIKAQDKVILQPYNSKYEPMILDESSNAMIVGEMVGVYKTFEEK